MGKETTALTTVRPRRRGLTRVYLANGVTEEAVRAALHETGDELKCSQKSRTRLVGQWVIKSVGGPFSTRLLKLSSRPARYRRGWDAACFLHDHGIAVPMPVAYVEWGIAGICWRNAFVSQYLDEQVNVEEFLRALLKRRASAETVALFLQELADAVNALTATGAYHADLSGKNIFTADGRAFTFIDLDAVVLGEPYDDDRRLKNHVQLYDSFCDELNDSVLVPFIERMLAAHHDTRVWMPAVRKGQRERRHRVEERWAKEGKPSKHLENQA